MTGHGSTGATPPLRLMLYDRTCTGPASSTRVVRSWARPSSWPWPGLSHAWSVGGALYRRLGRLDTFAGASSWAEGLDWILARSRDQPIAELQFWGHGEWGCAYIDEDKLDVGALAPGHPLHARMQALRDRFVAGGDALWWFRTCETLGTQAGHDFARAFSRFFGCRVAGHTHTINILQSGLHVLAPGAEPTWSVDEGVEPGAPRGRESSLRAPSTITCLHGTVPGP